MHIHDKEASTIRLNIGGSIVSHHHIMLY